jgi:NADPH:quinone reductase-like Zn-dependent oxidoreductase
VAHRKRGIKLTDRVGEWVLVTASAGGVGIAAVQLAKGAVLAGVDEAADPTLLAQHWVPESSELLDHNAKWV